MADGSPHRSARIESGEIATSTLAEIYAQQGLLGRALSIYRRMLARTPDDREIAGRIESLERRIAETGPEPGVERASEPPAPRERLPWDPPVPASEPAPMASAADPTIVPGSAEPPNDPQPAAVSPAEGERQPVAEPAAEPARRVGPIDAHAFEAWLERR